MPRTVQSQFVNKNLFQLDYEILSEEYSKIKNSVIDQSIAEVQIDGFRKGQAPRELALKKIDARTLGQKILEKVLEDFSPSALQELNSSVQKEERIVASVELDPSSENTGEQTDGTFRMRVLARLLPAIEIKAIEKLKIEQPSRKDIVDLPDYIDFKQTEIHKILTEQNVYTRSNDSAKIGDRVTCDMEGSIDGKKIDGLTSTNMKVTIGSRSFLPAFEDNLVGVKKGDTKKFDLPFPKEYTVELAGKTAQVTVQIKEVEKQEYKTIEELLKNSDNLQKYYKTKEDLEKDIEQVYNARIEQVLDNIRRRRVVEQVLQVVPDFDLDESIVTSETSRILKSLQDDVKAKGISLAQAISAASLTKLSVEELEKLKEGEIREVVEKYVRSEMKLTNILSTIYQTKVSNKPSNEEVEKTITDALENREKYSLDKALSEQQVRNIINDRIIRQAAGNYLLEIAKKNS